MRCRNAQLTVETKSGESSNSNQQSAKNLSTLPWIHCSPPTETNEEKHHAGGEQKDTAVIQLRHLLTLGLSLDVELSVGWWVIHELVKHNRDDGEDDSKIVAPAPAGCCVEDEGASDDGSEHYNSLEPRHSCWEMKGKC